MADVRSFRPCLLTSSGGVQTLGDSLVVEYLRSTAARARPDMRTARVFAI